MMSLRRSQTNSILGSSQNVSQLSLYSRSDGYSQASSRCVVNASSNGADRGDGNGARGVSGRGYLTSRRTVPGTARSLKETGSLTLSQARTRRKQERQSSAVETRRSQIRRESGSGGGEDLELYLKSFDMSGHVGARVVQGKATKSKSLPRGSNLDWAKLIESDPSLDDVKFENQCSDSESDSGNAFLKKSTRIDVATDADSAVRIGEAQTRGGSTSKRRISISPDIKYLDDNSSPNISDLSITDSLSNSSVQVPPAANHLKQVQARNLLNDSDRSLEIDSTGHVMEAGDLLSYSDIRIPGSPGRSKSGTKTTKATRLMNVTGESVSISEEPSLSESFDFKHNILSSMDQLEADSDDIYQNTDTSTFEPNIHDVHSLGELEELEDDDTKSAKFNASVDPLRKKSSKVTTSTEREKSTESSSKIKTRPSSFKFSATATTAVESKPVGGDHGYQKSINYSSDDFESESVSEVEESVNNSDAEEVIEEEESVMGSSKGVESESCDETVRSSSGTGSGSESEPSYSSFSETEQKNKSDLTESQQMDLSTTCTSDPPHSPRELSATESAHVQDACVQTDLSPLMASAPPRSQLAPPTGYPTVTVGHHYGSEYLDPTPILPHVVSPDALEAVTCYTPSVVALSDLLRTQLSITRSLLARSRQLAASVSGSISADYHYTTLEETKEYISKHRPKLLQFDEASKLVQLEQ